MVIFVRDKVNILLAFHSHIFFLFFFLHILITNLCCIKFLTFNGKIVIIEGEEQRECLCA